MEEGWHLATLFFLERLGVACLRRPMLQCKQDCLMHCHPLLFVQCLESPVGKRKRSMTVSTSQDPSFSGLNQVWTVSYSNLNPKFMCFIFVSVLFFLFFSFGLFFVFYFVFLENVDLAKAPLMLALFRHTWQTCNITKMFPCGACLNCGIISKLW